MDSGGTGEAHWRFDAAWLGQLDAYDTFALVAGSGMLIIAAAQALASMYVDRQALRLFALRYALAALGWWFAHPRAEGEIDALLPWPPLVVALALQTLTIYALDVYLDQAARRRTLWLLGAAAAALAALLALRPVMPGDPLPLFLLILLSMSWCAWQAARAARRERNVGLAWVAAAFASYPVLMIVALARVRDRLQESDLSYAVALPGAVVGVTILVVSLIRAVRRTRDALEAREAARQALQELNRTLEKRVVARTGELRTMLAGLEAFNRQVSHDLRGPLAGVSGLSRLALGQLDRGETDRVRTALQALADQGDRLQAMVNDLLALSRAGESELARRWQPMAPVVEAALDLIRASPDAAARLSSVRLHIDKLPDASVDAGLLRQAWFNLLSNALRFASSTNRAAEVELGAQSVDGETRWFLRDNGPGFPPARAHELFEAFTRLHGGGLSHNGIGLSIVRRIVELHGGRVWAESDGMQGATFWFTLGPADGDVTEPATSGAAVPAPR